MKQKAYTFKVVISNKRLRCEIKGATVKIDNTQLTADNNRQQSSDRSHAGIAIEKVLLQPQTQVLLFKVIFFNNKNRPPEITFIHKQLNELRLQEKPEL